MQHLKTITIALVALLALGGVAAAAAQAEEAPYWSIAGTRLGAGETKDFRFRSEEGGLRRTKKFVLTSTIGEKVTCTKQTLSGGSVLNGSAAGNPGLSEELIEFSGCTVEHNGTGCKVEKNEFFTERLKNELVLDAAEKRYNQVLFKPATGNRFATIKFEGAECTFKETVVEGEVVGEFWSDPPEGKGEEEKKEESSEKAPAVSKLIKFPATEITSVWLIKSGVGEDFRVNLLRAFTEPATLSGTSLMVLANETSWSVLG